MQIDAYHAFKMLFNRYSSGATIQHMIVSDMGAD